MSRTKGAGRLNADLLQRKRIKNAFREPELVIWIDLIAIYPSVAFKRIWVCFFLAIPARLALNASGNIDQA